VGVVETALTAGKPVLILLGDDLDGVVATTATRLAWLPRWAALKRHVHAVSCSARTLERNEAHGRYRRHTIIPLPVSVPGSVPAAPHAEGPLRLVYFGQMARHKGILESLAALAAFNKQPEGRRATMDFIGGGGSPFLHEVAAAVRQWGLDEAVRVRGPMERAALHRLLPTYDAALLLLPDQEAFGMVALEAAFLGLAPVLTTGPGVSALFPEDYPLFVTERADTHEICARLGWCLQHRAELRPLASQVGAQLRDRVSPNRVVRDILEFASMAEAPSHAYDLQELMNVMTMLEIRQTI
jgi:glycosyltransferase involved in cell wall biosynthesis